MALRDYELMYIVRPDVDDDGLRAAVESVKTLIEGQGGEVHKTTMWGKRRLAYEVQHMRDGHYVIAEIRLDGARVAPVERALRIHDTVFRHLLVVQEAPSAEGDGETEGAEAGEGENGLTATAPAPSATAEAEVATAEAAPEAEAEEPGAAAEAESEPEAAAEAEDAPAPEDAPAAADDDDDAETEAEEE